MNSRGEYNDSDQTSLLDKFTTTVLLYKSISAWPNGRRKSETRHFRWQRTVSCASTFACAHSHCTLRIFKTPFVQTTISWLTVLYHNVQNYESCCRIQQILRKIILVSWLLTHFCASGSHYERSNRTLEISWNAPGVFPDTGRRQSKFFDVRDVFVSLIYINILPSNILGEEMRVFSCVKCLFSKYCRFQKISSTL